jgi:hypothetical protein
MSIFRRPFLVAACGIPGTLQSETIDVEASRVSPRYFRLGSGGRRRS